MDAIADRAFATEAAVKTSHAESPSLLTVILDTNAVQWHQLGPERAFKTVLESLVIALNSHLALNSANRVAVIASHADGAQFLFPAKGTDNQQTQTRSSSPDEESRNATPAVEPIKSNFIKSKMYRQFQFVDETVLQSLKSLLEAPPPAKPPKNTLSASLSLALSYINKIQQADSLVKARILVVNTSPDEHLNYIPIMNCIFAAQKMKIPISVAQLSSTATFLQQAADATGGVYLSIENLDGLIQYLSTAFFIDPSLRHLMVKPTMADIDFRASCFLTGKVVDIGFVCSVCLCILSEIPNDSQCPACGSEFDANVIKKLKRRPVVVSKRKKRKVDP